MIFSNSKAKYNVDVHQKKKKQKNWGMRKATRNT